MIRVELFKLHYFDSLFDLNVKCDSAELLSTLLKYIHGCYIDPSERLKLSSQSVEELDIACQRKCIVHQDFYLKVTVRVQCRCTFSKELQNYYGNNFSHVLNGAEFLAELADAKDPSK